MQPVSTVAQRYDTTTVFFHWATAILVAEQWLGAQVIDWFPRGALRVDARSVHIVLGVVLAVLLAGRILWRLTPGAAPAARRQGRAEPAGQGDALGALRPAGGDGGGGDLPHLDAGRQPVQPVQHSRLRSGQSRAHELGAGDPCPDRLADPGGCGVACGGGIGASLSLAGWRAGPHAARAVIMRWRPPAPARGCRLVRRQPRGAAVAAAAMPEACGAAS